MKNDKMTRILGDRGKALVADLFHRNGYVVNTAASDTKEFIDFTASKGTASMRVFVRTDTRVSVTDNIVVERFTHREHGAEIGWLFGGKADVLCYVDACTGVVYCFNWAALKDYVITHCKARPFRNPYDMGATGDAYIVSLRKLLREQGLCICRGKVDPTSMQDTILNHPAPF